MPEPPLDVSGVPSPTQMPELLHSIVRWAVELMRADGGLILLWDPEQEVLVQAISHGFLEAYHGVTLRPGEGLGGRVLLSGQPTIIDDYGAWEGRSTSYEPVRPFNGTCAVPLRWQDQVIGVLEIDADSRRRAFGPDDIRLGTLFADLAALAIKNAQLYDALQEQSQALRRTLEREVAQRTAELAHRALQLETSAQVSREITAILEIGPLLDRVVELICEAFAYYNVSIFLLDTPTNHLLLHASSGVAGRRWMQHGMRLPLDGRSLNATATQTNQPVIVNDVSCEPRFKYTEWLPDTRSELVVPLRARPRVIGTLDVQCAQLNAFQQDDLLVIQSLGDQIAIAIENARLYDRSRELAVLEERTRLARELHDSVTQSLFSVDLHARALATYLEKDPPKARAELTDLRRIARDALQEIRSLIYDLRPVSLRDAGLVASLRHQVEHLRRTGGPELVFEASGSFPLPIEVEQGLYRIAQEALRNAIKHARAQRISTTLTLDSDCVDLCVTDDGRGFDPDTLGTGDRQSFGLVGLRERVTLLQGQLEITSQPGAGTQLRVRVPVQAPPNTS